MTTNTRIFLMAGLAAKAILATAFAADDLHLKAAYAVADTRVIPEQEK